MFGIGLPEMIVILAVALIVVGPDKLPDMARSVAKWVLELKKTVNQVKESLADEDNLIGSVQSDLRKTGEELKNELLESKSELQESDHFTWHDPGGPKNGDDLSVNDVIDIDPDPNNSSSSNAEPAGKDIEDADPEAPNKKEGPPPEPSS